MTRDDLQSVEVVHDLCMVANGVDLIIVYLMMLGLRQTEIADLMETTRQAVNDRLVRLQARYHEGRMLSARESKKKRRECMH